MIADERPRQSAPRSRACPGPARLRRRHGRHRQESARAARSRQRTEALPDEVDESRRGRASGGDGLDEARERPRPELRAARGVTYEGKGAYSLVGRSPSSSNWGGGRARPGGGGVGAGGGHAEAEGAGGGGSPAGRVARPACAPWTAPAWTHRRAPPARPRGRGGRGRTGRALATAPSPSGKRGSGPARARARAPRTVREASRQRRLAQWVDPAVADRERTANWPLPGRAGGRAASRRAPPPCEKRSAR